MEQKDWERKVRPYRAILKTVYMPISRRWEVTIKDLDAADTSTLFRGRSAVDARLFANNVAERLLSYGAFKLSETGNGYWVFEATSLNTIYEIKAE